MKLTLKQETFCKEYITNGGNATQAYKKAYDCSKTKDKTINENASRLLKDSKVRARLEELQQPFQEKFEYTMEQSFKKFLEIQEKALNRRKKIYLEGVEIGEVEDPDLTNAIKCEENKAKLIGLYATEKVEVNSNVKKIFITKTDEKEANDKIDEFIKNLDV